MTDWTLNPEISKWPVLDHVTDYRLTRQNQFYSEGRRKTWWSVLIELEDTSIDQFKAKTKRFARDLLIPAAYDAADRTAEPKRQPVAIFARTPLISRLNRIGNPFG
ncbi:MAG: hypothetical protein ABJN42_23530, partial [Roseibium sp.]